MGDTEEIFYLNGYLPTNKKDEVKKEAENNSWGYVFEKPKESDNPPVLIKNSKWVRIIEPVFNFMGTTPGYHEYDISIWFLLFFSLFFGMLIGDAGYGFTFLAITFFVRRKFKKAPFEPFVLMYVLSGATIIWGALSGTYFGSEAIAQLPILNVMVNPNISSFNLSSSGFNDNQTFMISLCFLIGAIHLTIAHLLVAIKNLKSLKMISQIGWVGIIWSLYFIAGNLVLGKEFPQVGIYLFIVSTILTLLFSNAENGILKGLGATLGSLPLNIISGFSDVVSYLRLFAVGYASVVVAHSFNQMAIGSGINSIASGIIAAIILLLGHSLNIVLGAMAIIVHGIRLNMLEFSGHLNMEWSGIKYRPFAE
jgi:V/A-type H+-transporting ATPase subunit I